MQRGAILASLVLTPCAMCQDWKSIRTKGVEISLPKTWKTIDISSQDFERELTAEIAGDERLLAMLPQIRQMRQAGDFRVFAFTGYVADGFAENVNLLYERLPAGASLADWSANHRSQLEGSANRLFFEGGITEVRGRTMARFVSRREAAIPEGPQRLAFLTYATEAPRGVWVITFTTLPSRLQVLIPIADMAAASLRASPVSTPNEPREASPAPQSQARSRSGAIGEAIGILFGVVLLALAVRLINSRLQTRSGGKARE